LVKMPLGIRYPGNTRSSTFAFRDSSGRSENGLGTPSNMHLAGFVTRFNPQERVFLSPSAKRDLLCKDLTERILASRRAFGVAL